MSHLPECGKLVCVCKQLRACEERVAQTFINQEGAAYELGYAKGYAAALDAARDIIAALEINGVYCKVVHSCDALAAIDALRGESNG
jgi:hypothetical protein